MGPEARGTADDGGRNPSCGTMDVGVVVEGPPVEPQSVKVSSTFNLLISCYKQLLFKLHIERGSNSFVGNTLL